MSLKAKLEAVVYAAEEPVTLAHLATIFAEEVLLGLAETAAQETEAEQLALGGLPFGANEAATAEAAPALEETPPEQAPPPDAVEPPAGETASAAAETSESDEKKLARQRDRRVRQALQLVLDQLIADYASSERGMEIREVAGGYRMATKPEYHDAVRGFVKSLKPPMKLSLQALETLAVIAYKQPVTAPEVGEIRGVDSGGVLGGLVSRKLITTAGRKQVIGRPILYKTTKEFLLRFGLKDLNDLPSMEEFEKMAGELAESEAVGEAQDASMRSFDPLLDSDAAAPVEPNQAEEENPASTPAAEPVAENTAEPEKSEPEKLEAEESELQVSAPEKLEAEESEPQELEPEKLEAEESELQVSAPEKLEAEESEPQELEPEKFEAEESELQELAPEKSEAEESEPQESAPEELEQPILTTPGSAGKP